MKRFLLSLVCCVASAGLYSQNKCYWQQEVDYKMDVTVDVQKYQYQGKQELVYKNNSSDTLRKVYYHLFYNAFQPGSEMEARINTVINPDGRMINKIVVDNKTINENRISILKSNEIGYLRVVNLKQDGISAKIKEVGTILEVILPKPMLPNSASTLTLDFSGQVPVQIRRAGRNNSEGVEFSMAQWYPKIAEFDSEGWHADPYIAREFHGVWGNFDVKITIDKDYLLGATGILQNRNEIGKGYQDEDVNVKQTKGKTLVWHFKAAMVHDFSWAADKNYAHDIVKGPSNVDLHFIYKNIPETTEKWKRLQPIMAKVMDIYNKKVGQYPYKQYSFIQAGDGGMEYAMCTFMLGNGKLEGIVGTASHELAHSWFQHVLASNESKHPWMDEGFTSYIEDLAINELAAEKQPNPFKGNYNTYYKLVESGKEQPLSTHADRYDDNRVYSIASYVKGNIFLSQLGYIIGEEKLDQTIKRYYQDFKFKHPTPNDIKRTAERVSGAELDWYLTDWTQTTNTIDYAIKEVKENERKTNVVLERIGRMPMPIDLSVEYTDGTTENFYIPLRMMHYEKENPSPAVKRTVLKDWAWAFNIYTFEIDKPKSSIKKISIDPSGLMADVKQNNNVATINMANN